MAPSKKTNLTSQSVRTRGEELYMQEKYDEALPLLKEAYQLDDNKNNDTGVFLAWTLAYLFQLNSAKELFESILERAPEAPGAPHGYWFTLKSLGLEPEAIRVAQHEVDRGILQFAPHLCGTLFAIGNLTEALGNIDKIDQLITKQPTLSEDPNVHHLQGQLYSGIGDWKQSALHFRNSINIDNPTFNTTVELLRACSYANQSADLEQTFEFCKNFSGIELLPIWTRYQLTRFKKCTDIDHVFKENPEQPIKSNHASTSYVDLHSKYNQRLWKQEDILEAKKQFKSPIINPDTLRQNIESFRILAAKLIKENTFDVWHQNFNAFKEAFGRSDWRPVQILSTGRCGTESIFNVLNQSNNVTAHHPFAIRLTPMNRNHLLYRIIEGNFDETVVKSILTNYLESRSAEYLYAIRQNQTFVTANHYDSIMAPFCAELFPESRFAYLARDETATFRSFYGKNQWRNRQLQHWLYDPSFPEGCFIHCQDETLPIEAHISWYFYLTKVFAESFFKTLPEHRHISLKSERLFSMEETEFDKLRSILPDGAITEEAICNTYNTPRNTKEAFLHLTNGDIEKRIPYFKNYMKNLEQTGEFLQNN